ncbi:MAG: hypothetical protein EZS28_021842 [Streblomastix strix]|uniref:Uncharacterized protein n=1 Tax=Streblomastix strix TaxID=222440 RepID=A0A5J4VJF6_9EUKA|nr:MAG: hypothetical protein EZS28_021842 [Streblomastix strix]
MEINFVDQNLNQEEAVRITSLKSPGFNSRNSCILADKLEELSALWNNQKQTTPRMTDDQRRLSIINRHDSANKFENAQNSIDKRQAISRKEDKYGKVDQQQTRDISSLRKAKGNMDKQKTIKHFKNTLQGKAKNSTVVKPKVSRTQKVVSRINSKISGK